MWSEGCCQKASRLFLVKKRTKFERGSSIASGGRCTSFGVIARCDDGLGMQYPSGMDMSIERSVTVTVTSLAVKEQLQS